MLITVVMRRVIIASLFVSILCHDVKQSRCFPIAEKEDRVKIEDRVKFFENPDQNLKEGGRLNRREHCHEEEIVMLYVCKTIYSEPREGICPEQAS